MLTGAKKFARIVRVVQSALWRFMRLNIPRKALGLYYKHLHTYIFIRLRFTNRGSAIGQHEWSFIPLHLVIPELWVPFQTTQIEAWRAFNARSPPKLPLLILRKLQIEVKPCAICIFRPLVRQVKRKTAVTCRVYCKAHLDVQINSCCFRQKSVCTLYLEQQEHTLSLCAQNLV